MRKPKLREAHAPRAAYTRKRDIRATLANAAPMLISVVLALVVHLLHTGYGYGTGSQDQWLPAALQRLDGQLFTRDTWVLFQNATWHSLSLLIVLVGTLGRVIDPPLLIWLLYVGAFLCTGSAIYRMAFAATGRTFVGFGTVLLAQVVTPHWSLGASELAPHYLTPAMIAWSGLAWALVYHQEGRWYRVAVLTGLAGWFDPTLAFSVAWLFVSLFAVDRWIVRHGARGAVPSGRALVRWVGIVALVGLPGWIGGVWPWLVGRGGDPEAMSSENLFYIWAQYRYAVESFFMAFSKASVGRFALFAGGAFLALRAPGVRERLVGSDYLEKVVVTIAGMVAFAFVFTELLPVFGIVMLDFYALTVWTRIIFSLFVAAWFANLLLTDRLDAFDAWMRGRVAPLVAGAVVVGVGLGAALDYAPIARRLDVARFQHRETASAEAWIRENTSKDALVLVPPSWQGFRAATNRSIVVNFELMPERPDGMVAWFGRMRDVAPYPLMPRNAILRGVLMDGAYNGIPGARLWEMAKQYEFDYVIRSRETGPIDAGFMLLHETPTWLIYEPYRGELPTLDVP